jgi:hypothetical protein
VLSPQLARALREHGLAWTPAEGDRFVLPDHDLDGRVFTISEMVVEVRRSPIGALIAFNGTTEWALDAIEQTEAVWVPREEQLRDLLGPALLSLVRTDDAWRVTFRAVDGQLAEVDRSDVADAYAAALLVLLETHLDDTARPG